MAKVSIKRRNDYVRADGRAQLHAVVCIDGKKIRLPIDIAVTSSEWDPDKECIKGRTQDVKDNNLILSNIKAKITDIFVKARLKGEKLTKETFLMLYHRPAELTNFIDFAEQHLKDLSTVLQPETQRHHVSTLKKLKAFNPDLTFSEITLDWLRIYAAHLRRYHGNNPNTIGKNMSVIRMHFNAARRAGIIKENPFEYYRLPSTEPAVVFLTEQELNSLIKLYRSDTLEDNEQDSLRFFLFMTFTAMHITDARNLQIENIQHGEIVYRRIKTGTRVQMPISVPAQKLIDYYRNGRTRGPLFLKLPANQTFNYLIKRICERVGITKSVSAKAARHTFATLYYKKNSGDVGTLSKLLGHTSINTTMIYAHIMKDSRVTGVSAFNDML